MFIAYVDDCEEDSSQALPVLKEGFDVNRINVDQIEIFRDGSDFLHNWHPHKYDLIILDILMNGITGIELAKKIRETDPDTCIVFCSTSNEYACESYSVDACYYLQKPLSLENTKQLFAKLLAKNIENKRFITLPDDQNLMIRQMISATYYNHLIEMRMEQGGILKTRMAFSGFLDLLKDYHYICVCNSGSCVNLYHVKRFDKDCFEMTDGSSVQVSRRRKNDVQTQYQNFLFRALREGK